jgi:8-oxo-dGTP pyrophosphatase MutT (NUDIX family)
MAVRACMNCGMLGHEYKSCKEPITSWGIILINFKTTKNILSMGCANVDMSKSINIEINEHNDLNKISSCLNEMEFLLVSRKHSLGYSDFMRGRYDVADSTSILELFNNMIPSEIQGLEKYDFDTLWDNFWNNDTTKNSYKAEYFQSKEKFEHLQNNDNHCLSMSFFVKNTLPFYTTHEWGFPKGRKRKNELDIECALREFCEETGLSHSDINIVTSIAPFVEIITGTNGIKYKHVYYVAEMMVDKIPSINISTQQYNEIGNIGFFNYSTAQMIIREYHIDKKRILHNLYLYCLHVLFNASLNASSLNASSINASSLD